MKKVLFYAVASSVLLFYYWYNSFYRGADIYLFSFLFTPLEFTLTLYLFLLSLSLLAYKKSLFLTLAHLLITFSLIVISQYTYALFFQFVYLLVVVDFGKKSINNLSYLLYLFFIHYALVLLFTSEFTLLYFFNLGVIALLLFREKKDFSSLELLACAISIVLLILSFKALEIFIYDIYIWLDIVDAPRFINYEILFILSLLHIFLFIFIEFKKK